MLKIVKKNNTYLCLVDNVKFNLISALIIKR